MMAKVPGFEAYSGPLQRLGGLTNRVYRAGDHCLRIPGKGTEEYIDRGHEKVAAQEAAKAGVSPEVMHFGTDGVMVSRFVEGAETMSPEPEGFSEQDDHRWGADSNGQQPCGQPCGSGTWISCSR